MEFGRLKEFPILRDRKNLVAEIVEAFRYEINISTRDEFSELYGKVATKFPELMDVQESEVVNINELTRFILENA